MRVQTHAIAEIERLGGSVQVEPVGPEWLRSFVGDDVMAGYDKVVLVTLSDDIGMTQVTGAGLVHLKGLKHLFLHKTHVTDAGLKILTHGLKELKILERLSLSGTRVTDTGLEHLKGMTSLKSLILSGTPVTDAGLVHLKGLTKLE